MRHNIHLYLSIHKSESRLLKITSSLKKLSTFERIIICSKWVPGLKNHATIDEKREIYCFRFFQFLESNFILIKMILIISWSLKLLFKFSKTNVSCVNCHSISLLPISVIFSKLHRTKLIYDTHELETETANSGKRIKRELLRLLERFFIRYVDMVIVVNDSIASFYTNNYKIKKILTIKNIPHKITNLKSTTTNKFRENFKIQKNEIIFIYQGLLIHGRGLDILIEIFSNVTNRHLVIMGYGLLEKKIKYLSNKFSNIHFHPAVPHEQVHIYTSCADVGLSLMENICLSYYYSLPNKFFEYINSEIPVIASDFPEMTKIIKKHHCGWNVAIDKDEIKKLILSLTQEEIIDKKQKTIEAKKHFDWKNEEKKLLNAYNEIGL